jgi:hypothetical protein
LHRHDVPDGDSANFRENILLESVQDIFGGAFRPVAEPGLMPLARYFLSNHAKLRVNSGPKRFMTDLTSLRRSITLRLLNLRQKYLACFHSISMRLSSGLYGGK